jgi:ribosomal protein S18 acetylase RimI-like enzyme
MNCSFRKCTADDLPALRELSVRTFSDTFRHLNTPEDFRAYLDKAFNTAQLRGEMSSADSEFYFLYADSALAGYLKLNERGAQTDINDPQSLEIERIYVTKEHQGTGLGGVLMNKALETAKQRDKAYVWLGVWEKNEKAIGFYKNYGFYEMGRHTFVLGSDVQSDLVMRKDL